MTWLYRALKAVSYPVMRLMHPVRVTGRRELPEGAAIVVSNHISNWDAIVLGRVFDRQVRFMAKKELFCNPVMRALMDGLGAFPVDRGGSDMSAIRKSIEILSAGGVVGIFPQGTRVKADDSFSVASGVSLIALRAHAAVVPVHINGPYRLFRGINVNIGEALPAGEAGARVNKEAIDALNARIRQSVTELKTERIG